MDYVKFFKWMLSLGKNSRFLPKLAFSKREGIFTLYYYPNKDSLICRYRFFYDGGDVLPIIGEWEEIVDDLGIVQESRPTSLPAFISKYFSFNITNLRKAIHRRSSSSSTIGEKANAPYRSVRLEPRIALINKDFFGQRQVRVKKVIRKTDWNLFFNDLIKQHPALYDILLCAAKAYDFSLFDDFFALALDFSPKGIFPPSRSAFAFFKHFVVDLQSNLC